MGLAGSNPGWVRPLSGVSPAVVPFPKGVVVMQKYIRFIIFAILIAIAFTLKVK